jgi:hypothetical protein
MRQSGAVPVWRQPKARTVLSPVKTRQRRVLRGTAEPAERHVHVAAPGVEPQRRGLVQPKGRLDVTDTAALPAPPISVGATRQRLDDVGKAEADLDRAAGRSSVTLPSVTSASGRTHRRPPP